MYELDEYFFSVGIPKIKHNLYVYIKNKYLTDR